MLSLTTAQHTYFPYNHLKVITLLLYSIEPLFSSENLKMEVFFNEENEKTYKW